MKKTGMHDQLHSRVSTRKLKSLLLCLEEHSLTYMKSSAVTGTSMSSTAAYGRAVPQKYKDKSLMQNSGPLRQKKKQLKPKCGKRPERTVQSCYTHVPGWGRDVLKVCAKNVGQG